MGKRYQVDFKGAVPMTKQQFRDGTRVDSILKKYATMGVDVNDIGLFDQHKAKNVYGLSDTALDYQQQLNKVVYVQQYFQSLPSAVRDKFRNDPINMLAFMADPKNKAQCEEMGLFEKPAAKPAEPAEKPAEKPKA